MTNPESIRNAISKGETFRLEELTYDLLEEAECKLSVLPVPEDFDERIRAFGNLIAQMCSNVRGKDERLLLEIRSVSAALSYLLNSCSFADGKYHYFDEREIERKLGRK